MEQIEHPTILPPLGLVVAAGMGPAGLTQRDLIGLQSPLIEVAPAEVIFLDKPPGGVLLRGVGHVGRIHVHQHHDHRHHHAQRQHAEEHQGIYRPRCGFRLLLLLAFLQLQVGQPAVGRRLDSRLGGLGGNEACHPAAAIWPPEARAGRRGPRRTAKRLRRGPAAGCCPPSCEAKVPPAPPTTGGAATPAASVTVSVQAESAVASLGTQKRPPQRGQLA